MRQMTAPRTRTMNSFITWKECVISIQPAAAALAVTYVGFHCKATLSTRYVNVSLSYFLLAAMGGVTSQWRGIISWRIRMESIDEVQLDGEHANVTSRTTGTLSWLIDGFPRYQIGTSRIWPERTRTPCFASMFSSVPNAITTLWFPVLPGLPCGTVNCSGA